jgi:acetate kinase
MKILVLNCGSSSVKFQFIETEGEMVLAKGIVEKIGSTGAFLRYSRSGEKEIREVTEVPNHDAAITLVLSTLMHPRDGVISSVEEIAGIGHRVVHGGEEFSESVLITPEVRGAIERCCIFAPLHNPANLKGIDVCSKLLTGKPQVGVFDTAFHQKMPAENFLYAIPYGLYRKLGIRRYGFHGTSHRYVAQKAAEELGRPLGELKLITCHLGNGASVAAISGGHSVDTSMGFTPLEGLMMGTRSGDLDPAVGPYLMEREKLTASEVDSLLNKRSGMLGISEGSNDMREIIDAMDRGSERHTLAFKMFCHRVRKYIGSYAAVLGGLDAVIFTGGIGENAARVRAEVLRGLEFLGIEVDAKKNDKNGTRISKGATQALVIPTNEELAIARDTCEVLLRAAAETEGALTEEAIDAELAQLENQDRRELVMLWAADTEATMDELRDRLLHKVGKKLSGQALRCELGRLGLVDMPEECPPAQAEPASARKRQRAGSERSAG